MPTADDYAWIHDTHLSEGACFAVVPAADRAAVLAAYGAREGSAFDPGSPDDGPDPFFQEVIRVVEVGDALVVIEDNGFEGTRPEVLGPLSRASGGGVAAAYAWNVNADTTFTTARAGTVELTLDLYAVEHGDEELDDLPAGLHQIAVAGGGDEGDAFAAGLAMVATHTATPFTATVLDSGTCYEIEPTPEALSVHTRGWYDPLDFVPGAMNTVTALPDGTQRALAEWATAAAVREAGMTDDAVVRQVLDGFGSGLTPPAPEGLDQLVRTTAREHGRFVDLETDLETGGIEWPEGHPYYEAFVPGMFGGSRAISHLEGCYLAQRRGAVDAVRRATNADAFTAAVDCLTQAAGVFGAGRTTRGWTFTETAEGRWRGESEPGPRHQQFVRVVARLLSDLAAGERGPDVWVRADAGLPRPLTDHERVEAIHADAVAAARGDFAQYQVARAEDFGDPEDPDDVGHGWEPDDGVFTYVSEFSVADLDAINLDPAARAELDSVTWAGELAFLTTEVARLDALLGVLERPGVALAVIGAAPSVPGSVEPLATAFGIGEDLARVLLGTRLRPVQADDLRRFRDEREMLAAHLDRLRRD